MDASLRKQLAIWLLFTAVCVFGMIVIGGLTRLTESGLSIVEWKPLSGTLPPLTEEAWLEEFAEYQTSPQYQKINKGMTLEEFKGIFWLEYWHRVGGRAIGFVFLLPMLYFFSRYSLPRWVKWRTAGIFALGGLQGVIGWYMVKSGLVDVPQVSQYRLALHLGVAFLIMAACIWVAREVMDPRAGQAPPPTPASRPLSGFAGWLVVLVFVQVLLGALVAGLHAGLVYNTFPLMDGQFVPKGLYVMDGFLRNHFENVTMVQFQHRIGAYVLAALLPLFVVLGWRHTRSRGALALLLAVLAVQIALGILTLIHGVPLVLASKHQAVAAVLFALMVWVWYDFRKPVKGAAEQGAPEESGVDANGMAQA